MFMLPKGDSRKKYIDESTCLFNLRINNARYESKTLATLHVMQALLLQEPSKPSKLKKQFEALTRRLSL